MLVTSFRIWRIVIVARSSLWEIETTATLVPFATALEPLQFVQRTPQGQESPPGNSAPTSSTATTSCDPRTILKTS